MARPNLILFDPLHCYKNSFTLLEITIGQEKIYGWSAQVFVKFPHQFVVKPRAHQVPHTSYLFLPSYESCPWFVGSYRVAQYKKTGTLVILCTWVSGPTPSNGHWYCSGWGGLPPPPPTYVARARICKPYKEPRNQFLVWLVGTTTLFDVPAHQAT